MYDVAIVGGGPGGLSAGVPLAGEGFRVVLLEEHADIGQPVHCTGVLAREAFDEFDLPRQAVLNELHTARFYSPSGHDIAYTTRQVEALVIDRRIFDDALGRRAERAGVEVRRGARVAGIDVGSDGVVVTLASGTEVRARACVLACGASYGFGRRLGLGIPSVFLHSAQAELRAERLGDVELHFGGAIAPKGFAWAVPVLRNGQPHVRVGVMAAADAGRYFSRMIARIAPRWGIGESGCACQPRQKILPLAPIERTYSDRLLAVGDSAGLVKPTTGGGIYYSLVSAGIAAKVLGKALRANDASAGVLREYETAWKRRLAPELEAQLSLRLLAQRLTDDEIDGLFELARTNGIMPIVRSTARFNRHRNFILALFKHAPARKILFRRLAGSGAPAAEALIGVPPG